jgi:hypothetical protein
MKIRLKRIGVNEFEGDINANELLNDVVFRTVVTMIVNEPKQKPKPKAKQPDIDMIMAGYLLAVITTITTYYTGLWPS